MKKAVLLCDLCTDDPRFASESVRVTYAFGSRNNIRLDLCDSHLDAWNHNAGIDKKRGTTARIRTGPVTTAERARELNEHRRPSTRYVQCDECDEFITLNNMTQHQHNRHNGTPRKYREVTDAPQER